MSLRFTNSLLTLDLIQNAHEADLIEHAYVRNSSTTVVLIKAVDSWKLVIDRGGKVVSTFLDLRKAFDSIDHNTLLNKMRNNGELILSSNGSTAIWMKDINTCPLVAKNQVRGRLLTVFHKSQF